MFEDIIKPEQIDFPGLPTCGKCNHLYELPHDCITDNRYCPIHKFYVRENSNGCSDGIFNGGRQLK